MDLCWQSSVSAFKYAVQVGCSFSSKEQASFNFLSAVTISDCCDFGGPPPNKVSLEIGYFVHIVYDMIMLYSPGTKAGEVDPALLL